MAKMIDRLAILACVFPTILGDEHLIFKWTQVYTVNEDFVTPADVRTKIVKNE
jgi:hypothetical protein